MTGTTLPSAAAQTQAVPPVSRSPASADHWPAVPLASDDREVSGKPWWKKDSRLPAWLASTLFHTALLVLLALIGLQTKPPSGLSIRGRQGTPSGSIQLDSLSTDDRAASHDSDWEPREVAVDLSSDPATLTLPTIVQGALPEADSGTRAIVSGTSQQSVRAVRLPGGGLGGRSPALRSKLGRDNGATAASERAVEEALRWIAEHQLANGSWSFDLSLAPCNGRCRHSKQKNATTPSTAATGLALLAFLGAGYTHEQGPYTDNVRRGIYYLREIRSESAAGYDWQQGSMYGQGIALMALAEAMAMSTESAEQARLESDLYPLVSKGAWFTVIAQHEKGSWGYVPGSPGDTTLTGWQVLSLIAAKRRGVPLQTYTLRDAKRFVMSTSDAGKYSFGYQGPPGERTTTAIGLTLLMYLGQSPDYTPFYQALTDLAERGPMLTNVYHDYYASLALHHSQHPDFPQWNAQLRDFLVAKQATSGHERGSWHFTDKYGDVGGRLYTTAMCTMILEVYYRYLPLYDKIEEFPL